MKGRSGGASIWMMVVGLLMYSGGLAAADKASGPPPARAATLTLGGTVYVHRWSKGGQNEFTPDGDDDLTQWRDMVTINTHERVRDGEQLAALANSVMSNYQRHGKIVRTDSKPRTPQRPAEHFIAAILGNPQLLEAVFARVVLIDGTGEVVIYSHRIYGKEAAASMGEWMKANGPTIEKTLMSWDRIPSSAALGPLPQSR